MKLISWNVNGIRACVQKGFLDIFKELDADMRAELADMRWDTDKIYDAFHKELSFGTSGLRGIMGAGTNRMNRYVVRKVTQGVASYIKKN